MKKDTINYKKLQPHELCSMFPMMGDEDYNLLVQSMKDRGYDRDFPIVLYEDKILDGQHRYTAARKARVEPSFDHFKVGDGDPFEFVIARNLARRHLTVSQAADLGAQLVEKMRAAEKARKAEEKALKKAGKDKPKAPKKKREGSVHTRTKAAKAARLVGVSERAVEQARQLRRDDPAAAEEVKAGRKKLGTAIKETAKKKSAAEKQSDAFADAKRIVAGLAGDAFALAAEKKLTSKDFIKLSHLEKAEVVRIQPLIESGWALRAALGYKSTQLSLAHPQRLFIDRCVAQNGQFTWECEAYGKTFKVHIEQQ